MTKENWKWKLKRKIEDGTIKVNVNGEEILMKKSKILPLKKSPKEWKRIHPPIDEYGNIKWFNLLFGGKVNAIKLGILLAIIAMALFGIYQILNNPCVDWCVSHPELVNQSGMLIPTCSG